MNESLQERILAIEEKIHRACERAGRTRESVRLIAVTKNHPVSVVQELIDLGIKDIGENRVQEIEEKAGEIRGEFTLHLIGHLQTNKVGRVLPLVKWIQSVDREKLISRIDFLASGSEKIRALVEVNTSGEASKSGCAPEECKALCEAVAQSKSLQFCGLMTIGPLTENEREVRNAFALLRKLGEQCLNLAPSIELSMGMSSDFEWAIEEGATMVRIGTALVGMRA